MMRAPRWIAIALLWLAACSRDTPQREPEPGPPKMQASEMDRAVDACRRLVERVCRCAEKDPAMKPRCELDRSRPDGLDLHIRLLKGEKGPLNAEERRMTEGEVRTFLQACVQADAELDPAKCAR